jgi:hypothetical protein
VIIVIALCVLVVLAIIEFLGRPPSPVAPEMVEAESPAVVPETAETEGRVAVPETAESERTAAT